jgi:glucose/arabinose dehydrogenase
MALHLSVRLRSPFIFSLVLLPDRILIGNNSFSFIYIVNIPRIGIAKLLLVLISTVLLQGCQKEINFHFRSIDLRLIADGFVSPVIVTASHHSERLYVVDQIGKVWVIDRKGYKRPTPFMDISSRLVSLNTAYDERGLIGFALHPAFKTNGRFFVYYQLPPRSGGPSHGTSWNNLSRVSEFTVLPDVLRADMRSEKILLEWDDPQFNHNGGSLAFGPDNFLYIAIGDGGGASDTGPGHVDDWYPVNTGGNAQHIEANFLGKILCIDIDAGAPYGIPSSNPFINKPGRDEIFAFGFRNPSHISFDMEGTHQLIVSDAGEALWEEINVVTRGGNYGWNVKEGIHCFSTATPMMGLPSCPSVDNRGNRLIDPVIALNNWQNPPGGTATGISGGYVYRGDSIGNWKGKYVFGTFSQSPATPNGELFVAARQDGVQGSWTYKEVKLKSYTNGPGYYLRGLGQDNHGEIYVAVSSMRGPQGNTGKVFKLVEE